MARGVLELRDEGSRTVAVDDRIVDPLLAEMDAPSTSDP